MSLPSVRGVNRPASSADTSVQQSVGACPRPGKTTSMPPMPPPPSFSIGDMAPFGIEDMKGVVVHVRHWLFAFEMMGPGDLPVPGLGRDLPG